MFHFSTGLFSKGFVFSTKVFFSARILLFFQSGCFFSKGVDFFSMGLLFFQSVFFFVFLVFLTVFCSIFFSKTKFSERFFFFLLKVFFQI